jgi:hypothetical protein
MSASWISPHCCPARPTEARVLVARPRRLLSGARHAASAQVVGARISEGEPSACGSIPPRSRTALGWASGCSCVAVPPWIACLERACPSTNGISARAPRSAPVPRQETLDGHEASGAIRHHRPEACLGPSLQVLVEPDRLSLIPEADTGCGPADRCRPTRWAVGWRSTCGLLLLWC